MLAAYLLRTTQLLQNPPASASLYAPSDLTSYINTARGQIAGESECVRVMGTLALTAGTQVYPLSSVSVSGTAGVAGVLNVRGANVSVASGQAWLHPRPFPYFQTYYLNNPVPQQGMTKQYSQFGQGAGGSLYVNPVPDQAYTLNLDCVCYPIALVDDTTAEAIPYPWTDCVPYYAAFLALMSAQRTGDADHMWQQFQTFMQRARQMANPSVNPMQAAQSGNPTRSGQLGMQGGGQ